MRVTTRRIHVAALAVVAAAGPAALLLRGPSEHAALPVAEATAPATESPSPAPPPSPAPSPTPAETAPEPSASPSPAAPRLRPERLGAAHVSAGGETLVFGYWTEAGVRLYYRLRGNGAPVEVVRGSDGSEASVAGGVDVSAQGNRIAFASEAPNLVPGDRNGKQDVFVYDIGSKRTELVSVGSSGGQGDDRSWEPSISADGRYVAFVSDASNLVPGDENGKTDVFVRDLRSRTTVLVSATPEGRPGNGVSTSPSIDDSGNIVVFASEASDLTHDDADTSRDAFVRNLAKAQTTRVPIERARPDVDETGNVVAVSPNGRYVALAACNRSEHKWGCSTYAYDREMGTLSLEDEHPDPSDDLTDAAFSRDGRILVRTLMQAPGDGFLFIRDRATRADTPLQPAMLGGITADGRYVSVLEEPATTTRHYPLIYDRVTGTFTPTLTW